jgi:GT2 family glycosyltransferase
LNVTDVAVIVVSTNEANWLDDCLGSLYANAGELELDVVVVDNDSTDGTGDLVRERYPEARVLRCENHGFAHANNRALFTVDARYVLFLNPDTRFLHGSLQTLVDKLDASPEVGLAGCVQRAPDGSISPTMRRFPSALTTLAEAFGAEHVAPSACQAELNLARYETEFDSDFTVGAFMLVREEALGSAGWLDERLFLFADEVDFAHRIKDAGFVVRHYPCLQIEHHAGKAGYNPRRIAQYAYAQKVYARKYFSLPGRVGYLGALALRYAMRLALFPVMRRGDEAATESQRAALRILLGRAEAPYEPPPIGAVRPWTGEPVQERLAAAR